MQQQAPSRSHDRRGDADDEVSSVAAWLAALVFVVALGVVAMGAVAG